MTTIDSNNLGWIVAVVWLVLSLLGLLISYGLLYVTIRLALRPSTDRIVEELRDLREVLLIEPGRD